MLYNANGGQVRTSKAFKTMTKSDVDKIYESKDRYNALFYARKLAREAKNFELADRLRNEQVQLQAEIYRKYDITL